MADDSADETFHHAAKSRRGDEEGLEYSQADPEEDYSELDDDSEADSDDGSAHPDAEYSSDDDDGSDGSEFDEAGEVPDVDDALNDPTMRAMCNYMLSAAQQVQQSSNLQVSATAFEALQEWCHEFLWLPRQGFEAEDEDGDEEAVPLLA